MKWSSFPYVVQKEILDHLSINNLFFFSLCSKRTKNFIVQTQKCQFHQKVEHVNYWIGKVETLISVKRASRRDCDLVMGFYTTPAEFAMTLSGHEGAVSIEEIRVNVLGVAIQFFRSRRTRSDLHVKCRYENLEATMEIIHNCLNDVLGHDTKSWLSSGSEQTYCLPKLRNIQMLALYGGRIEPQRIDRLLSRTARFEYLSTTMCNETENGSRGNLKLYDADTVYAFLLGGNIAKNFIEHFSGRHLFISAFDIYPPHVASFLNAWRSGEKFRNIEVICVENRYFYLPYIRHFVEFKEVNTEVEYSFVRRFQERDPESSRNQPWEFKSNLYMVRESDGHVASVMLTHARIFMGVWDLTEAQFLQRFQ